MGDFLGAGGTPLPGMIGAFNSGAALRALGLGGGGGAAPTAQPGPVNPLAAMLAAQGPQYRPGDTTWGFAGDRLMRFTPQQGPNPNGGGGGGAPGGAGGAYSGAPQILPGQGGISLLGGAGGAPDGSVGGVTRLPNGGFDLGPAGQSLVDLGHQVADRAPANPAFDAIQQGQVGSIGGRSPYDTFHGGVSDELLGKVAEKAATDTSVAGKRGLPPWNGPPLTYAQQRARQQAYDASLGIGGQTGIEAARDWGLESGEYFNK